MRNKTMMNRSIKNLIIGLCIVLLCNSLNAVEANRLLHQYSMRANNYARLRAKTQMTLSYIFATGAAAAAGTAATLYLKKYWNEDLLKSIYEGGLPAAGLAFSASAFAAPAISRLTKWLHTEHAIGGYRIPLSLSYARTKAKQTAAELEASLTTKNPLDPIKLHGNPSFAGDPFVTNLLGKLEAKIDHGDNPGKFIPNKKGFAGSFEREMLEIMLFLTAPERAHKLGIDIPRGILLYGPPGTGKTLKATELAAWVQAAMKTLAVGELKGMWHGLSEENIRTMFEEAQQRRDNLDKLSPAEKRMHAHNQQVAAALSTIMLCLYDLDERIEGLQGDERDALTADRDMLIHRLQAYNQEVEHGTAEQKRAANENLLATEALATIILRIQHLNNDIANPQQNAQPDEQANGEQNEQADAPDNAQPNAYQQEEQLIGEEQNEEQEQSKQQHKQHHARRKRKVKDQQALIKQRTRLQNGLNVYKHEIAQENPDQQTATERLLKLAHIDPTQAPEFQKYCILFIDEIDAIGSRSGNHNGSDVANGMITTFLDQMDGADKDENKNIIVIGTTNRLELLDRAMLRPGRFDLHVYIGNPATPEERLEYINFFGGTDNTHGKYTVDEGVRRHYRDIAAQTENFSQVELDALFKKAGSIAMIRSCPHATWQDMQQALAYWHNKKAREQQREHGHQLEQDAASTNPINDPQLRLDFFRHFGGQQNRTGIYRVSDEARQHFEELARHQHTAFLSPVDIRSVFNLAAGLAMQAGRDAISLLDMQNALQQIHLRKLAALIAEGFPAQVQPAAANQQPQQAAVVAQPQPNAAAQAQPIQAAPAANNPQAQNNANAPQQAGQPAPQPQQPVVAQVAVLQQQAPADAVAQPANVGPHPEAQPGVQQQAQPAVANILPQQDAAAQPQPANAAANQVNAAANQPQVEAQPHVQDPQQEVVERVEQPVQHQVEGSRLGKWLTWATWGHSAS